jgi:hypothetical protein
VEQVDERGAVERCPSAPVLLREPGERDRIAALRDHEVGEEAGAVAGLLEDLRRPLGGQDRLATLATRHLLHVDLSLEARRHVLVDRGLLPGPERLEGSAAARADLPLLRDRVGDLPRRECLLLLRVGAPLGDGRLVVRGSRALAAELVGDRRHLLRAPPEDVALQLPDDLLELGDLRPELRDRGVRGGELDLEPLRPIPPLTAMLGLAAHRRR